ncbi:lytic transglycosylase [Bombiscardovia nodaiensis]|uniref:Lytic transglycosylase n=1 Tax=Bombiscardovia nodaiensis TaxID=2932181 RepID=A0ABM8BAC5_9BIFI|nr:lytic transglycosylase [Bombiscardovia nodaiensis]
MSKRWTPQQFIVQRRIRVILCATLVALSMVLAFALTARKSVALSVNGQTRTVTTYASSVDALLRQEGIERKTHDLVETSSGGRLTNHATVTVQSAYQTTINIDGQQVPFWTTASSVDQLLGFFEANRRSAAQVRVDVTNIYNQLTGGLAINHDGPVTVIADGKRSVAPDGKLPAASILDSKGIVVGKEDRISVQRTGDETVLRVQRVTHGQTTQEVELPFSTRTVVDGSLAPGQSIIRQPGQAGIKQQIYETTFVDGVAESSTLTREETTRQPIDQVVAVGPARQEKPTDSNDQAEQERKQKDEAAQKKAQADKAEQERKNKEKGKPAQPSSPASQPTQTPTPAPSSSQTQDPAPTQSPAPAPTTPAPAPTQTPAPAPSTPAPAPAPDPAPTPASKWWHASPDLAQVYAGGAAAQRGWTGQQFDDLVQLWNRESGWRWWAGNPTSSAYGIPQANPGSKMSKFGENWRDDAAVQVDWGLWYIANRYQDPSAAWKIWQKNKWY